MNITVRSTAGFRVGDTIVVGGEPMPVGFWRRTWWHIRGLLRLRNRGTKLVITGLTGTVLDTRDVDQLSQSEGEE